MSAKTYEKYPRKQNFTFKIRKHLKKLPKVVMLDHLHSENVIVEIFVKRATKLAERDRKPPSAYVYLSIGKRKLKSAVKLKEGSPEWNEVFEFSLNENETKSKLKVEVWHKKGLLSGNVFLGYCTFDLSSLVRGITQEFSPELMEAESGNITLELTAHGFGQDKPQVSKISELSTDSSKSPKSPSSSGSSSSSSSSSGINKRNKKERYKIQSVLGSGGQGSVFIAQDHYLNKRVVLKRIVCESFEDANMALQENRTLNHGNIVHYTDVFLTHLTEGQSKGKFAVCFIMDFCEKGDLSKYIKRRFKKKKYLTFDHLVEFSSQIIAGLQFLHDNKIMHRDLKPHNVFLTNDWKTLKVGDFGYVRELDKTYLSTKCGSPGYMAPEVAENLGYNTPADIWSLGVVLFELATLRSGKVHFVLATQDYAKYRDDVVQDLKDRVEYNEFIMLIVDCLQLEPAKRPTIEQLTDRIAKIKQVQVKEYLEKNKEGE